MATSLGDALPDLFPHLREHAGTVLVTAEGVAIGAALGVTLGSFLTYIVQHNLRLLSAHVEGIITCDGSPVPGAAVTLVGEYGPASNAVFSTRSGADGTWTLDVTPGLYSATLQPAGRPQMAPGIVQVDVGQTAHIAWAGC